MGDFDISALAEMESKPFKVVPVIEVLLNGAVNSNPKIRFYEKDVQAFIEGYVEAEESLADLLEFLMTSLQESTFFKALQKSNRNNK